MEYDKPHLMSNEKTQPIVNRTTNQCIGDYQFTLAIKIMLQFMGWATTYVTKYHALAKSIPLPNLITIHPRMTLGKQTHDLTSKEGAICFLSKVCKYRTHLQNLTVPLIPLIPCKSKGSHLWYVEFNDKVFFTSHFNMQIGKRNSLFANA